MSQSATPKSPLNTHGDNDPTTSLGRLFQCLTSYSAKNFSLIFNLTSPGALWGHPFSCCPLFPGKRDWLSLATTSFQGVVESKKIPPNPDFLHAEPPQIPQLILIRFVIQTLHQLPCLSLQYLSSSQLLVFQPFLEFLNLSMSWSETENEPTTALKHSGI